LQKNISVQMQMAVKVCFEKRNY